MLLETFAVPTAVISMRWPWISRASDPPFYGFRLLEGPQGHRRRTADHLSRKGRRSRRGGAQHVRCRPVGAQIPGDCPELAAQLGPGHPVLCVPRRGPADHLHHQRNRSLEREAASRRKNARPFSNRRSSDQTALPRLARCRRGMENAAKGVVRSQNSIRHYVRRKVRHGMMVNPAPHTKFLTVPLHEEISADYTDMIYAASVVEIEERRKAFLRKWRLRHRAVADSLEEAGDKLFAFTRLPPSQWKSARTTNAIERLHEEFKRRVKTQTVLPSAETAAMLFWALLASGQIQMRKVDGWQSLSTPLNDQPVALAA